MHQQRSFGLVIAIAALAATSCGVPGAATIVDGYTDRTSYVRGDRARIYVNAASARTARLRLFDVRGIQVGYVDAEIAPQAPTGAQPWADGFGYSRYVEYVVPAMNSGLYLWEMKIPMLIRSEAAADIVVVYPSNTESAYNRAGGRSLYYPTDARATAVSFQRPLDPPVSRFSEALLKWMAEQAYSVKYVADQDLEDYARISNAKLLVIIGHSEYWTRVARQHFDRFVAEGHDALILSGNTMWWQVRYSDDGTRLICYKALPDPIADPLLKTINWNQPSLLYSIISSIGVEFPLGGYGLKQDRGWDGFKITDAASPIFAGLTIKNGDIVKLPSIEYDGAPRLGLDSNGVPIIDASILGFAAVRLIGFDYGFRDVETVATWIAFRKTATSGVVINGASTDWASFRGIGGTDGATIAVIISNMISSLLGGAITF